MKWRINWWAAAMLVVVMVMVYAAYNAGLHSYRPCLRPASDTEVWASVRKAVEGRRATDVKVIVIDTPFTLGFVQARDRQVIVPMLSGLQEAIQTKKRYGNRTLSVTVYWKAGGQAGPFGFSNTDGWKHAFSRKFAYGFDILFHDDPGRWIDPTTD